VEFEGKPEGLLGDERLLDRLGLELPPAGQVGAALRRSGVDVPFLALDSEALAAALWH
jgi:hypothetical protein